MHVWKFIFLERWFWIWPGPWTKIFEHRSSEIDVDQFLNCVPVETWYRQPEITSYVIHCLMSFWMFISAIKGHGGENDPEIITTIPWATLKERTVEWRNRGTAESRNCVKSPKILKDGMTEQRKIAPNPQRRNYESCLRIRRDVKKNKL